MTVKRPAPVDRPLSPALLDLLVTGWTTQPAHPGEPATLRELMTLDVPALEALYLPHRGVIAEAARRGRDEPYVRGRIWFVALLAGQSRDDLPAAAAADDA